MSKKALITGITGQDGSYLAELLLSKGYEVHGIIRRASTFNTSRLDPIYTDPHVEKSRLFLHYGDLSDGSALARLLAKVAPNEIYNLAAQSHVRVSFDCPEYTADITGTGTIRLLEAIPARPGSSRDSTRLPPAKCSGMVREVPQIGKDAVLPAQPLWLRQSIFLLADRQLSGVLRASRQQRHSLSTTPRISPPRRNFL